jgi:hypothetical protein
LPEFAAGRLATTPIVGTDCQLLASLLWLQHRQASLRRWRGNGLPAHVQAEDADSRDCLEDQDPVRRGSGLTGEFSSKALAAASGSEVLPEISLRA